MSILVGCAIWASLTDIHARRIPNLCCVVIAICGLSLRALAQWYPQPYGVFSVSLALETGLPSFFSCILWAVGVLLGGIGIEWSIRRFVGSAGFGLGDIKYCAAWACTLGWLVVPALASACFLGALSTLIRRKSTFAFGPWISIHFIIAILLTSGGCISTICC